MLKRTLCLALVLCLVFSLTISAGAVSSNVPTSTTVHTQQLGCLQISTTVQDSYVTKSIDRSSCLTEEKLTDDTADYPAIRKELVALGLSQQTVDDMEDWYLLEYANSPSVTFSEVYYEISPDGTSHPVSEAKALASTEKFEQTQILAPTVGTLSDNGFTGNTSTSYMRLELVVTFLPGHYGLFSYRTAATWLIPPPALRGKDYLGSSCKNSSIVDSTRTGFIRYDTRTYNSNGSILSTVDSGEIRTKSFDNAENGTFSGSAGIFTLPKDQNYPQGLPHIQHRNIRAAYYYQAKIDDYSKPKNVKATASYLHQVYGITITPQLVIDAGTAVSGSIGVSLSTGYERTANLSGNFRYIPEK